MRKDMSSLKPENIGQIAKSDLQEIAIAKMIEK
jgi:hypothetical protein